MASAFDRLNKLPEVFSLNTLASFTGGDTSKASVYINRWKQMGYIDGLGPRIGIYFNLLKNPNAKQEHFMAAIQMLFPDAVMSGASVIHASGWTTQIPQSIEFNILSRRSIPHVDGAQFHLRTKDWFFVCQNQILKDGFAKLKPEIALADSWKSGSWRPDVDDLDFDQINTHKLKKAFVLMGCPYPKQYPGHFYCETSGVNSNESYTNLKNKSNKDKSIIKNRNS